MTTRRFSRALPFVVLVIPGLCGFVPFLAPGGAAPAVLSAQEADPSPERPSDPRTAEWRAIAEEAAALLAAVGYPVDLDRVTIEGHDAERFRNDITAQNAMIFGPDHFADMAWFVHALGLLDAPSENALLEQFLGAFSQVAVAYYQGDRDTFCFVEGEGILQELASADLRPIVTHELVHAHQDQQRRLEEAFARTQGHGDRARALHMLIEGEAEFASARALGVDLESLDGGTLDEMSALLAGPLAQVYQEGRRFITARHAEGGTEALRAAFETLPTSTEQVLHPRKYRVDTPTEVTLPPLPYAERFRKYLGELETRFFIAALAGDPRETFLASTGWDGDTLVAYDVGTERPLLV